MWQGDITAAGTEGIVNAANNEGWLGSGVAGAIRRAAGDQVEAEAVAQAPWPVGDAVRPAPPARRPRGQGDPARRRHGPRPPGQRRRRRQRHRGRAGLAAAEGLASVALPALGTGVGGVPLEAAAAAMGAAVRDHAAGPAGPTVVFALYDRAALERFGAALERELGAGDGS